MTPSLLARPLSCARYRNNNRRIQRKEKKRKEKKRKEKTEDGKSKNLLDPLSFLLSGGEFRLDLYLLIGNYRLLLLHQFQLILFIAHNNP